MKKFLFAIIALCAASCSSDDDIINESATDQQAKEIASVLIGTFVGSEYSSVTNTTETIEITFNPYSTPQEIELTIPGDYVDIDKKAMIYGECDVVNYYNDHLLQTNNEWRYSVEIPYEGAQPELVFYPISIYGRYETHDITIINSTSFVLDDITYNKQ